MGTALPFIPIIYRNASLRIAKCVPEELSDSTEKDIEERSIWSEREAFMACKILRIMSAYKREKAVYVGGWWHLTVGDKIPTLRDLLGIDLTGCLLINGEQWR
jgi:hypothetical protein